MRLHAERNTESAYLYLDEGAAVANRLVFTEEDDRPAWGINLDFAPDGRLLGIEFESADQAPRAVIEAANRF